MEDRKSKKLRKWKPACENFASYHFLRSARAPVLVLVQDLDIYKLKLVQVLVRVLIQLRPRFHLFSLVK